MLHSHPFTRTGFWLKTGIALLLAALADALFFNHRPGTTLGVFALAWLAGVAVGRPGLARDPRARFALAAALLMALILADRPGPLAWTLFGLMLGVAVLSARVRDGDPVWRWAQRLVVHAVVSAVGPVIDLARLTRPRRRSRRGGLSLGRLVGLLLLPLVGGAVFLALFASANPLISNALDQIRAPALSGETILRAWFWGLVLLAVGATLRPRWRRRLIALPSLRDARMPGVSGASITLSLVVFNALFALQNGLDLAFLWSGAPLPDDMSLADYAHRGAYPLIATALLAGLFVLVALRPGSETAKRPLVRGLVVLWVGQNMLLVASSLLRTADYIEAYALTRFRIAAMIWMVLVAAGLLLILWRMLRGKDGHWLIDANVRLTLVVLGRGQHRRPRLGRRRLERASRPRGRRHGGDAGPRLPPLSRRSRPRFPGRARADHRRSGTARPGRRGARRAARTGASSTVGLARLDLARRAPAGADRGADGGPAAGPARARPARLGRVDHGP